jgi:hypothetical protein
MEKSEVIKGLAVIVASDSKDASFAASLMGAVVKGTVTPKQQACIDRLLNAPSQDAIGNLVAIVQRLANSGDKYPKVKGTVDGVEWTVALTPLDSTKAKPENRGTCAVASGKWGTPDNRYAGRILADGQFVAGKDLTPAIADWLKSLAAS